MNTEEIVAALQPELDGHIAAGKHVAASHCRQQIVAHQTVARLRAEHDTNPSKDLASQIRSWVRRLDRDVDPVEPVRPKRRKGPGGVDLHTEPAEITE